MAREEPNNREVCNLCGDENMQIKEVHLSYEQENGEVLEIEVKGEVCDSCDEIVLYDDE
tara:strand:+ start:1436 stop:1612 length:177 start_codon:yes stop_codon:yes gene_type:complete